MATSAEKLAQSLEVLTELQSRGVVAIRTGDISRTHSERLRTSGAGFAPCQSAGLSA